MARRLPSYHQRVNRIVFASHQGHSRSRAANQIARVGKPVKAIRAASFDPNAPSAFNAFE